MVSGTDRAKTEGEAETVVMIVLSTGSTCTESVLGYDPGERIAGRLGT
jgi:hypothetical protein